MESDNYMKTREAYRQLGRKYIENSAGIKLHKLEEFMKLLPKGGRVLDVGCFGGRDSKKFADGGFEVTGIDVVDIFIEEAKKYVPQAKFLEMDMLEMDFPENYFDAVVAHAVLLHLERKDVPRALAGLYRVLKPGGKLYAGVKMGQGQGLMPDKMADGLERYFTYFSKEEYEGYIKDAGFKVILSDISGDYVGRGLQWIVAWGEKPCD
jgi:SAM-dependent methyltransferase